MLRSECGWVQLSQKPDPSVEAQMPPDVKSSRLKKTLTNAGLYPTPEKGGGARLKTQATGSMAAFTSGESGAALNKGGGDPM